MSTTLRSSGSRIVTVGILTLLLTASSMQAQGKPETFAQQSAEAWLQLVDSVKYAESWDDSASLFKAAVAGEQWEHMLHATRDPLGKLQSRKLKERYLHKKSARSAPTVNMS